MRKSLNEFHWINEDLGTPQNTWEQLKEARRAMGKVANGGDSQQDPGREKLLIKRCDSEMHWS